MRLVRDDVELLLASTCMRARAVIVAPLDLICLHSVHSFFVAMYFNVIYIRAERRLYHNCLQLVFRMIGMIAASLRVTVCGHEIGLDINRAEIMQPAVQRVAVSLNAINKAKIEELAAQAGFQGDDALAEMGRSNGRGWMKRLVDRRRQAFLVKLHATLWGLILGIVDDLLASTRIELLSDRISLDIVPSLDPNLAQSRRSLRLLVFRGLIMSVVFTPIALVAADRFL